MESDYSNGVYPDLYFATANSTNAIGATTSVGTSLANINALVNDAKSNNGNIIIRVNTNGTAGAVGSTGNVTAYGIYGVLTSNPALAFCIDSTGATDQTAAATTTTSCQ